MATGATIFTVVGIGADEHPPTLVVENDLVEIDVLAAAERAGLVEMLNRERVILEIEAHHLGLGRHGINPLLAPGTEKLQRVRHVHFGIVEFRRR